MAGTLVRSFVSMCWEGGCAGLYLHSSAEESRYFGRRGGRLVCVPAAFLVLGVAIITTALLAGKFYYVHKGDLWSMYFLSINLGILLSRVIQ